MTDPSIELSGDEWRVLLGSPERAMTDDSHSITIAREIDGELYLRQVEWRDGQWWGYPDGVVHVPTVALRRMVGPMADIAAFHIRFGLAYGGKPRTMPEELRNFRTGFLREETEEYVDHVDRMSLLLTMASRGLRVTDRERSEVPIVLAGQLDALVDLVYVAMGNAYMQGFDFEEAWRRVHAANMAKERAQRDGDSQRGGRFDVIKPPGWTAPDHTDLVSDHAHREELK